MSLDPAAPEAAAEFAVWLIQLLPEGEPRLHMMPKNRSAPIPLDRSTAQRAIAERDQLARELLVFSTDIRRLATLAPIGCPPHEAALRAQQSDLSATMGAHLTARRDCPESIDTPGYCDAATS